MRSGFRSNSILSSATRVLLLALFLIASSHIAAGAVAQAPSESRAQNPSAAPALEKILAGMDEAAGSFKSVAGDLEYTKVTVIVDDHSTEKGKVYFDKDKNGKARVMLAFQDPAEKYVLFSSGMVSIYHPKIAEVEEYKLANNEGLLEQFLLLGFGTSGSELQKAYRISVKGEESVDGEQTVHLDLVPKNAKVAAKLQHIELWLSPQTWQPVQQKFFEPSKDFLIARYRNLLRNTKIAAKSFQLPLRGKVRTIKPQGP
jgi:outer membrane lipoprotein-sorting protein